MCERTGVLHRQHTNNKALMHATTSLDLNVDDTVHQVNLELHTASEDEMAVWGYLMTRRTRSDSGYL